MANPGFEESQTAYRAFGVDVCVGQFRRFGEFGPAYEVLSIASTSYAAIRVVASGEELDYHIERLQQDPIAITIP